MRKYRLWIWSFVVIMMIAPIPAHTTSAINTIQTQVDKALDVLRNPAENKVEKEKRILALADEIFDYTELSRLSLANYWKAFTPEQQKEFTHLFGKLLARDYMDRIMMYTNEKVTFGKEMRLSENMVEVDSDIITNTRTIQMAYRMILERDEWKVYDIERDLRLYGVATPIADIKSFANWIYSKPARCPSLRLGFEVWHKIVRNITDEPTPSDLADLVQISCLPYVDLLTLDRRMRGYVSQACKTLGMVYATKVCKNSKEIINNLLKQKS